MSALPISPEAMRKAFHLELNETCSLCKKPATSDEFAFFVERYSIRFISRRFCSDDCLKRWQYAQRILEINAECRAEMVQAARNGAPRTTLDGIDALWKER